MQTEERCYIVENPDTGYRRFFYFTNETHNSVRDAAFRYANRNQTQKIPTTVYISKMERIWEYYPTEETEPEPKPEPTRKSEPKPADFPNF